MKKQLSLLSVIIFILSAFFVSCAPQKSKERTDMKTIVETLRKENIQHYVFTNSQGNAFVVVPKFGARILAVSVGDENVFWTHPDVLSGQGGQRSWVSPEGGDKGFLFNSDWTGNRDFSKMDPGNYEVVYFNENKNLGLQNSFKATSNDQKEDYDLSLTREMAIMVDPLAGSSDFQGLDYEYLGINFVHKLRNNSAQMLDRILALWCLIQVPPKGTMIVPVEEVTDEAWRGNYFEPIPEDFVKANVDSFSYFIHGSRRYKVGIRPESSKEMISYIFDTDKKQASLVFMTFPVKPDARYVDRPKIEQETNGDVIQIYSHLEKSPLAFGELECHSWALDLRAGGERDFPIKIHMYRAPLDVLKKIGKELICPGFDQAHIF
jgi:hypothetical protein